MHKHEVSELYERKELRIIKGTWSVGGKRSPENAAAPVNWTGLSLAAGEALLSPIQPSFLYVKIQLLCCSEAAAMPGDSAAGHISLLRFANGGKGLP